MISRSTLGMVITDDAVNMNSTVFSCVKRAGYLPIAGSWDVPFFLVTIGGNSKHLRNPYRKANEHVTQTTLDRVQFTCYAVCEARESFASRRCSDAIRNSSQFASHESWEALKVLPLSEHASSILQVSDKELRAHAPWLWPDDP